MDKVRTTRVEIDLDNIQHNLNAFRATADPGLKMAAVVKANAYGHDIVKTTALLLENEVDYIAVATLQEALLLRQHFAQAPLFVMGHTPDRQLSQGVDQGIALTIFSLAQAQIVNDHAQASAKKATVHVKVDTGFNRIGYRDHGLALEEITAMAQLDALKVEGMFSHLALNSPEDDARQHQQLVDLADQLNKRGIDIANLHICDSIAAVAYPQYHMDMVRMGALLYGYCSRETSFELKPAMTLRTEVSMVKEIAAGDGVSYSYLFVAKQPRQIATLPLGYADGLPRNIWKEGRVMINGTLAPFAGLPCMDQCMVDVTGLDVAAGDEVILFGGQGEHQLHLDNLAQWCGTNKNELLTRISPRVPRVYYRNGAVVDVVE